MIARPVPGSERDLPWRGRLAIGRGFVTYAGPAGPADRHQHHAAQIAISLSDAPLTVTWPGGHCVAHAVSIPGSEPHSLTSVERIALILVDRQAALGRQLAVRWPAPGPIADVPIDQLRTTSVDQVGAAIVDWLTTQSTNVCATDVSAEVAQAMALVRQQLPGVPRLTSISNAIGVSADRLRKRFTCEVGLPFRRYVLWLRLGDVVATVARGADLTTAAADAGFADSAHLSRVFRANFGLAPSAVLNTAYLSPIGH